MKRFLIIFYFLLTFQFGKTQNLKDYFIELPLVSLDNLQKDRSAILENKNTLITNSDISFSILSDKNTSFNLCLFYNYQEIPTIVVNETIQAPECDYYYTYTYSKINNVWIESTADVIPFIYCMLYFDDSKDSPIGKICFDQNVNWEYKFIDSSFISVQPLVLKGEQCFESYITNLENWKSIDEYNGEMKAYYSNLKSRLYDSIILKWNKNSGKFEVFKKM